MPSPIDADLVESLRNRSETRTQLELFVYDPALYPMAITAS